MSNFHFFTDIDLLNTQAPGEEYGVIDTSGGMDNYRISDLHTASGTPRVFAPVKGVICAQEDSNNSTLLHLILKPTEVPKFNFYPIKYILIKGVLKNSLVSGGEMIIDPSNDLLSAINSAQEKINQSVDEAAENPPGTTNDGASSSAIGLDINSTTPSFSDTDPIDNLFYRDNADYQFPNVFDGWVIGKFDPAAFGIEIILESVDYNPSLSLTRNLSNKISVTTLSGGETQAEVFEHWHKKKFILNHVDPASFYGSFIKEGVKVKDSSDNVYVKKEEEIFTDVLKGTSGGNFNNRSKIYLDLRNEHNEPFNYYGNYGNDFYLAYDDVSPVSPQNYYSSGWPLFVLDNTSLPTTITTDKIPIKLAFATGDNNAPLAFFRVGYRKSLFPFRRLKGKKRFLGLNESGGVTGDIELIIPNADGSASTTPVSSIVCISFLRRYQLDQTELVSSGTKIEGNRSLDNLFLPVHMKIPFTSTTGVRVKTYNESLYVHRIEEKEEFVADVGIAKDNYGTTFLAYATDRRRNGLGMRKYFSFSSESVESNDFFVHHITKNYPNISYQQSFRTIGGNEYQVLRVDRAKDNYHKAFKYPKVDELLAFYFSSSDMAQIETEIVNNNLLTDYKIFLGLSNKQVATDDDSEPYTIYDVILRGFVMNLGVLETIEVPTNLKSLEL